MADSKLTALTQNTTPLSTDIAYMVDDPLFRGFWENGKFLFSNAVFFVGQ